MSQPLWHSIPYLCILLPLGSAAVTSVLKPRWARYWTMFTLLVVTSLSGVISAIFASGAESYTYMMGHFPAPWGNEIRAGQLEAVTALFFSLIMLLSLLGGLKKIDEHIDQNKVSLYYVVLLLLTAALMAQVYTNDIFTAYVFLEIMTLAACALIAIRKRGRTLVAATRYMIMNLIGSGLFLLGIILLYDLTGHLLMSNMKEAVAALAKSGQYQVPLTVVVALISIGLSIKSALFPFHTWVPDAYAYSTPTSAAVLSSLVSKGYIFLLMKIMYRVIGLDVIVSTGIQDVLFVFALVGMVMGSISAIRQTDIRRMIAFSSVAQIGYVFMGIGLGTDEGMMAATFHIFSHAVCKSMLFLAAGGLADASNNSKKFRDLRGAGFRSPIAGVAFTIGALSMVGFPFLGGFASKLNFALAAMDVGGARTMLVLITLAISTWLNTLYFLRTVITLYRKPVPGAVYSVARGQRGFCFNASLVAFSIVNVALGLFAQTFVSAITAGDIGAVLKLSGVNTGDTLCAPTRKVVLDGVSYPNPTLSMAIAPKTKGEEDKVAQGIFRLVEEDPTIKFVTNAETHQMVISGLGEQHLDVIVSKLKSKFGVDVTLQKARVPYRETIRKKVQVQGRHKKQTGGHGQFGDVWIVWSAVPCRRTSSPPSKRDCASASSRALWPDIRSSACARRCMTAPTIRLTPPKWRSRWLHPRRLRRASWKRARFC